MLLKLQAMKQLFKSAISQEQDAYLHQQIMQVYIASTDQLHMVGISSTTVIGYCYCIQTTYTVNLIIPLS